MLLNARVFGYFASPPPERRESLGRGPLTLFTLTFCIPIVTRSCFADDLVTSTDLVWRRKLTLKKSSDLTT